MLFYEFTRGLAYRRINHPSMSWYTLWLPLALSIIVTASIILLPAAPTMLGKDGFFGNSLSIVSTLPGFYFAGLAAVATFDGINMDAVMPSPPPKLRMTVGGATSFVELSRRQFLSYLFSYLVICSFILCIASLAVVTASPSITLLKSYITVKTGSVIAWSFVRSLGIFGYLAISASLVVTTLQGVFFLTERIHQP